MEVVRQGADAVENRLGLTDRAIATNLGGCQAKNLLVGVAESGANGLVLLGFEGDGAALSVTDRLLVEADFFGRVRLLKYQRVCARRRCVCPEGCVWSWPVVPFAGRHYTARIGFTKTA